VMFSEWRVATPAIFPSRAAQNRPRDNRAKLEKTGAGHGVAD
jgi:hypothetical protein